MIVLDTNVVSELFRPSPEPRVETWLSSKASETVFLSAISEAELRLGVAVLPGGRRKHALTAALEAVLSEDFSNRILPFDSAAASLYADIAAHRRAAGRPISPFDGQIAAIARSNAMAVATRNRRDFEECGVEVIDPWREA